MSWFADLTGFDELDYERTRARLAVSGTTLRSRVNGRSFEIGTLETPSLAELRARAAEVVPRVAGKLLVSQVVGDAGALHRDPVNRWALFQVASQFNLLEMTGPDVTPEDGVTRYAWDRTQGPAGAIAAGAATIYRNYFVPVDGGSGQTASRQIDCLRDVSVALGHPAEGLWAMRNGYALCSSSGLARIDDVLGAMTTAEVDVVRDGLRVGVHSEVEVTGGPVSGRPHARGGADSALVRGRDCVPDQEGGAPDLTVLALGISRCWRPWIWQPKAGTVCFKVGG